MPTIKHLWVREVDAYLVMQTANCLGLYVNTKNVLCACCTRNTQQLFKCTNIICMCCIKPYSEESVFQPSSSPLSFSFLNLISLPSFVRIFLLSTGAFRSLFTSCFQSSHVLFLMEFRRRRMFWLSLPYFYSVLVPELSSRSFFKAET